MKGEATKHARFVRELVREITGFAPYERRVQELLKISKDKRALKFCKKRLGTHIRGKRKREEMQAQLQKSPGVVEDLKGQESTEILQEKVGNSHQRQEEEVRLKEAIIKLRIIANFSHSKSTPGFPLYYTRH